ncbi:DegT/DnrJ/EryC1/StrS family aminotransferase [Pseudomonadota bacterium]|nr:DegT/DnrJ/EryC1/StrS family aminotransferase [Pseudomonadota bacterium]
MDKYRLASTTWGDEEINAINKVVEKGFYSMSDFVFQYEKEFAEFFGSRYCIMTSSGSTANLLMIAALFFTKDKKLKLKRGDEIIVPAVSWSTTYFPLQQYGLKVKFVDIDPHTLNFKLDDLETAISDSTKVILAVNLLGNPNDFERINNICSKNKIMLLEDNCESMGAEFNGRFTGTFGLMGTFSSFFSHHISTMEGGCILTDNEEIHHILLSIRAHGWTRNLPNSNYVTGEKSKNSFEEAFKFVLPGYNVRPLEMSGAIGSEQLKKLKDFVFERRQNAAYFVKKFENIKNIQIQKEIGSSSWFGFSIILNNDANIKRSELLTELEKNNIEVRPIVTGDFTKNKEVLEYFDFEIHGKLENAKKLDSNGFFVGNHHYSLKSEIDYLFSLIEKLV